MVVVVVIVVVLTLLQSRCDLSLPCCHLQVEFALEQRRLFEIQYGQLARWQLRTELKRCKEKDPSGDLSRNGPKQVLVDRLVAWHVLQKVLAWQELQQAAKRRRVADRIPNMPYARWYALKVMRSINVRKNTLLSTIEEFASSHAC